MGQLLAVRCSEGGIIHTSPLRITPQLLLELQDNAQIPIPVDLIVDCVYAGNYAVVIAVYRKTKVCDLLS